jgi:apolipoprotein N-acyltransferase
MKNDSQPSHETLARLIPLACGLGGMALLWLAQPPLAWWPLAWIAPLPWLWLVTRSELPGDRPYRMLWLAGVAYWLAMLNWIPMAHPLQYVNWLLLSGYLGVYLPLFVRVSRVAVHRLGVPLWVVAPVAWVACDYAMAHVITGISMATPAHSQLPWLAVVQCVDWAGQYTLAFVMMLVAAAVGAALFARGWSRYAGLPVAAATMVAVLGYGYAKLGEEVAGNRPTVRMALVQGNEPAVWEADPDRDRRVVAQYRQLTQQAIATANAAGQPIDFVLWPECMFRDVLFTYEAAARNDPEHPVAQYEAQSQLPLRAMASETGANLIVGLDRTRVLSLDESLPLRERMQFHNSAAIVDRSGRLVDVFDKYHLVLMGEYLPFADWFPWVYEITPMALGLTPGAGPVAPEV